MSLLLKMVLILLALALLASCQTGQPLQADAGQDFSVAVGDAPTFDGCGSTGEIVNYRWTIAGAPKSRPQDEGRMIAEVEGQCTFTWDAPMTPKDVGIWTVALEVRDATGNSGSDTVQLEVTP